jgi:hypothetical protein
MDGKLIEKIVPEEIRSGYTFSRNGIVTSPGKFEGETIATLYYYDAFLNSDDTVFEVSDEEKSAFGIDSPFVYLAESNDGFASLEFYNTLEDAQQAERIDLDDIAIDEDFE